MAHQQPLGGGGMPTDITSGLPLSAKVEEQRAKDELKEKEAVHEANLLFLEMAKSPVLALLAEQLERRMVALANQDSECQTLVKIIRGMRSKLDTPKHLAQKLRSQTFGPQLNSIIEGPQAAP